LPERSGETEDAGAVKRDEGVAAVALVVVAVVAPCEKGRERRLEIRDLPIFDGLDDAERARADADAAVVSEPNFRTQVVADVAGFGVELLPVRRIAAASTRTLPHGVIRLMDGPTSIGSPSTRLYGPACTTRSARLQFASGRDWKRLHQFSSRPESIAVATMRSPSLRNASDGR
jgi:hypothetical protein